MAHLLGGRIEDVVSVAGSVVNGTEVSDVGRGVMPKLGVKALLRIEG